MNEFDQKCFYRRKKSELSEQDIAPRAKSQTSDFGKLVLNVFQHMGAAYLAPSDSDAIYDIKSIAYNFYTKFYLSPNIAILGEKEFLSVQTFVDNVFLDASSGHKNKIAFLTGNVGVGKTSTINYLITHHLKYKITENNWFVRLDIDKTVLEHYHQPYHIINSFVEKVCRVLNENESYFPSSNVSRILTNLQKHYYDSYMFERLDIKQQNEIHNIQKLELRKLIEAIRTECNKRLIIIFDNIDILYYHTENVSASVEKETHTFVTGLMELFIHDRDHLGALGANLLFVMRLDTYHYLKSFGKISGKLFKTTPYTIEAPDWKQVIDVRYDLLRYIINNDKRFKNKEELGFEINRIYTYFIESKIEYKGLIEHIRELTNNGLRELMEYFRNYGWISEVEHSAIERFNSHTHIGLISFILNGKKVYSQINSLIPNLFLNCLIPYSYSSTRTVKHLNTYWLKYLILQFTIHCDERGESISESQIFDIFSQGQKSYPTQLVKEVLEVLCDPSRFSMFRRIRTYIDVEQYDLQLVPTEKAKHIFNEFSFKFFYLQLVVDDYLLAFPRELQNLKYNRILDLTNQDVDYSYITADADRYSYESKRMVVHKAKLVLYFLEILKTSYKFESIIFNDAFEELSKFELISPDFNKLADGIKDEIRALNKIINYSISIEGLINSIDTDCKNIGQSMESCYIRVIDELENKIKA